MLNQGHGHYSLHRHSCIEKAFKVSRDRGITTLCEAFIHLMITSSSSSVPLLVVDVSYVRVR